MCGRFTLFAEEYQEIRQIVEAAGQKNRGISVKTGEIFPGDTVPVLLQRGNWVKPEAMLWGYRKWSGSGLLIHARSETAEEKPTFRESLYHRRCVIPTTGFFEWDKQKRKHRFVLPSTEIIWLAGLYQDFQKENRFVILTTTANASMEPIHSRMPVLLAKEEIENWLFRLDIAAELLQVEQPALKIAVE